MPARQPVGLADDGPLLDYAAAAERLHVSVKFLQSRVQARDWPHHRFGARVRFTEGDLADILAATRHAPKKART